MDENDPLSKENKTPLGYQRTMVPFISKSTSKLRSALYFRYSIVILHFILNANTAQS